MRIAGIYSFNRGKEVIAKQHRSQLEEVLQVIEAVDAEQCKTKVNCLFLSLASATMR